MVLAREPETVTPLDDSRSAVQRAYAGFLLTRGDAISALTAYDLFLSQNLKVLTPPFLERKIKGKSGVIFYIHK